VAGDAAGTIREPAALADAVDQGRATEEELAQYGQLLFEAAFGRELWQHLLQVTTGQPYLELAIRGVDSDDQVAMQALRWEALHDGAGALAARGDVRKGSPSIAIVRIVPGAGQAEDPATRAELQPIRRRPRVLFAVGSRPQWGAAFSHCFPETTTLLPRTSRQPQPRPPPPGSRCLQSPRHAAPPSRRVQHWSRRPSTSSRNSSLSIPMPYSSLSIPMPS